MSRMIKEGVCVMRNRGVSLPTFIGVKAIYNRGELVYADPMNIAIVDDLQPEQGGQKLGYGNDTVKNQQNNHMRV